MNNKYYVEELSIYRKKYYSSERVKNQQNEQE